MIPKTADEILNLFDIVVDSDRLSDGSHAWNVLIGGDTAIGCINEDHARQLALDIAVAIRNHTGL